MRPLLATLVSVLLVSTIQAAEKETLLFEMRVYYAAPGKLDALHARFRDHTCQLFAKHGMTNIGYWVPVNNPENKLIYILAFPDRAARDKSFKEFVADPAWKKASSESEKNGRLVSKIESTFLQTTDYSPAIAPLTDNTGVIELRTYTASPGNLDALNARFRNHTVKLFEKHGMTNVGYWTLVSGQAGAENTLVYLLKHDSQEAAKKSFDTFRQDPAWVEARKASEVKAGGSLTAKDGVKSLFLQATDYSPNGGKSKTSAIDGDWTALFNGKNLAGWSQRNGTATYRVEGDCVVGKTSEGSPNSFLCTKKTYGNFELKFEVKVDDALNSGVQIRSRTKNDNPAERVHGPQVEISTDGMAAYVYAEGLSFGWLTPSPKAHKHFRNGEWNRYHVIANGKSIKTYLNDELISDFKEEKTGHDSGFIGLQVHGIARKTGPYEVRWRNIQVKELP